jgi:hypothetical protein
VDVLASLIIDDIDTLSSLASGSFGAVDVSTSVNTLVVLALEAVLALGIKVTFFSIGDALVLETDESLGAGLQWAHIGALAQVRKTGAGLAVDEDNFGALAGLTSSNKVDKVSVSGHTTDNWGRGHNVVDDWALFLSGSVSTTNDGLWLITLLFVGKAESWLAVESVSAVDILALVNTLSLDTALVWWALEVVSALWDFNALAGLAFESLFAVYVVAFVNALSIVAEFVVSAVRVDFTFGFGDTQAFLAHFA